MSLRLLDQMLVIPSGIEVSGILKGEIVGGFFSLELQPPLPPLNMSTPSFKQRFEGRKGNWWMIMNPVVLPGFTSQRYE